MFIVSNTSRSTYIGSSANIEGWAVYAHDDPVRSYTPLATLSALGPFLAYRDLGDTFKWAYFGTSNADTAFFPRGAANAVKGLDPDMPIILSGRPLVRMPQNHESLVCNTSLGSSARLQALCGSGCMHGMRQQW